VHAAQYRGLKKTRNQLGIPSAQRRQLAHGTHARTSLKYKWGYFKKRTKASVCLDTVLSMIMCYHVFITKSLVKVPRILDLLDQAKNQAGQIKKRPLFRARIPQRKTTGSDFLNIFFDRSLLISFCAVEPVQALGKTPRYVARTLINYE